MIATIPLIDCDKISAGRYREKCCVREFGTLWKPRQIRYVKAEKLKSGIVANLLKVSASSLGFCLEYFITQLIWICSLYRVHLNKRRRPSLYCKNIRIQETRYNDGPLGVTIDELC